MPVASYARGGEAASKYDLRESQEGEYIGFDFRLLKCDEDALDGRPIGVKEIEMDTTVSGLQPGTHVVHDGWRGTKVLPRVRTTDDAHRNRPFAHVGRRSRFRCTFAWAAYTSRDKTYRE